MSNRPLGIYLIRQNVEGLFGEFVSDAVVLATTGRAVKQLLCKAIDDGGYPDLDGIWNSLIDILPRLKAGASAPRRAG